MTPADTPFAAVVSVGRRAHLAALTASTGARSRIGLLPNFCSLPMVLSVVLYGELLAILLGLASSSPLVSLWERLGPLSLLVLIIALLTAAALCLVRRWLVHVETHVAAVIAWLVIVGIAVLVAGGAGMLLPWLVDGALFPEDGPGGLMIRAALIAAIVGALMLRYLYLHDQWRRQVEAVANARFKTLQARIRPHFLFNSMNTIASLTRTDPKLAEEVVEDLADLFRASLATDNITTSLAEELELVRRYINIEAQRLGERMIVEWDTEGLPGEAPVPPLILQPLVENAVYHGIQPSPRPGRIQIVGRYRRGIINLSIRNSLPPAIPDREKTRHGNRMAVQNVSQRLEAMYPGTARMSQSRIEGDYLVRLSFPYTRSQA
jgi:two-component system sensor histidine kinase AlgZ